MTHLDESTKVFNSFQHLKKLQHAESGLDLEKAKELYYQKFNKNYKLIMGYDEATWKGFCAQPELQPLTTAKADRLVKIYQTYIVDLKLKQEDIFGIDSLILMRLASNVDKQNVKEWLNKARVLSRSDMLREIKFGEVDELACNHKFNKKVTLTCELCGTKKSE